MSDTSRMSVSDWAAWGAIFVSLLGVMASLAGVHWQNRKQWLLHSAAMVTALLDKFESEQFESKRRRCGQLAAQHLRGECVTLAGNYGFGVLGFFEHVGHLVRRGALDEEMVWNRMGWEVMGYYSAFTSEPNLIEQIRVGNPTLYVEMEWLHMRMLAREVRSGACPHVSGADGRPRLRWMDEFITQECALGLDGAPKSSPVHPTGLSSGEVLDSRIASQ